ncbi:benenodin family lasso peptide [Sphingosinicella rhizophila]|uniref:Benenodin family lasso peptide n=1 Tax=Sphingosinicella rhizophila TaxID=3050082 RepID=A0ABU3Q8Z6_9SPHN|nr:benenodin family lasso peptide [Sphingosinicella sp. GR2756]MDT9599874.1 benenodin family lasso peptide [Sphingosinicella sp. GR2756]
MERDTKTAPADLIDLGSVSTDTQGPIGDMLEPIGFWHKSGISND